MEAEETADSKSAKPLRSRRAARIGLMSALYQIEVGEYLPLAAIEDAFERENYADEAKEFIRNSLLGVVRRQRTLDDRIAPLIAANWDFDRIALIDKILLRIACYELYHVEDMPPKVTINEAVSLAKIYSTAESGRFINGVLAKLYDASPKSRWDETLFPIAPPLETEPIVFEEPEEETVEEGSEEHQKLVTAGGWTLRKGDLSKSEDSPEPEAEAPEA